MDDERKIVVRGEGSLEPAGEPADPVEKSKREFLREVAGELQREQVYYDVGREFAGTRRNRTFLVPAVVLGLLIVLTAGSLVITIAIQRRIDSIRVDIRDFEDVNLREVLDQVKNLETDMQTALRDKEALAGERESRRQAIRADAQHRIDLLVNDDLSESERAERLQEIRAREAREIRAADGGYAPKLAAIDTRLREIQSRREQYDAREMEQAKEREQILNNQRLLFEHQGDEQKRFYEERIARLTADYQAQLRDLRVFHESFVAGLRRKQEQETRNLIARYNPTFADPALKALLEAPIDRALLAGPALADYRPLLGEEGVISPAAYQSIRRKLVEYQAVVGALQKTPYLNSVPAALAQLEARNLGLLRELEAIWGGLAGVLAAREATIARQAARIEELGYAMESLVKANGENGYILDPRDPADIAVYVDRVRDVSPGMLGFVFRRDDLSIGVIRFTAVGERVRASLVRLEGAEPIRPFDKVLIQAQPE